MDLTARAEGLRRTIGILFLLNILSYADRMIITMMVGPIKADLAISDVQIAFLVGLAFALFYTICGLPMGAIADRVSRRKLIFFGVTGWSIMTAYCGIADSFTELAIGRAGVGLGEAVLVPAAHSIITEKFGRKRATTAMAVFVIGAVVGTGIATSVGGTLIHAALEGGNATLPMVGEVHAWQLVFLWLGGAGLLMAPLAFLINEGKREAIPAGAGIGVREVMLVIGGNPRFFIGFILAQTLVNITVTGIASWAPEYTFRELGMTRATLSIPYGLLIITFGIIGNLTAGRIIDGMVARGVEDAHAKYQLVVVTIAGPIVALLFTIDSVMAFYAAVIVFYLGLCPYLSYGAAALQLETPASARGKIAAIFTLVNTLTAQAFGPLLIAVINDEVFGGERLGYSMAVTAAITLPLAIVCVLIAMGTGRCKAAAASAALVPEPLP